MKIKFLVPALITYTLLQGIGCNKSDSAGNPDPVTPPPSPFEKVVTSVSGRVIDELGLPVNGATVTGGTSTTTTDINGAFTLSNATLFKTGGFISVEKNGYLTGKRTFQVEEKDLHFVTLRLLPKETAHHINAASGGSIITTDGSSITFEPGSFLTEANNSTYTGTVTILFQHIDPNSNDFAQTIPGSILGRTKAGNLFGTIPRYMFAVQLTGSNGEKLKLNEAVPATFNLPIAPADFDTAPEVLTISSLNDSTGLWQEESVALKQLNGYMGKVNHFSFWSFHTNFNYVTVTAVVKKPDNVSVPNAFASLAYTFQNVAGTSYGYSDTAGLVRLIMPVNATAQFKVTSRCGELLHESNTGKVGVSKSLDTIRIAYNPGSVTFTGTALNCSDDPVANGQVYITVDNFTYTAAITNGNYSLQVQRCSGAATTAHIKAVDLSNAMSKETDETITTGNVSVDPLSICDL